MSKDVLREHLEKGWIHAKMFFEVMGASPEIAEGAMADHLKKIRKMDNIKIIAENSHKAEPVESPPKQFEGKEAYSQIVELEIAVSSLENLIYTVIFFGPSSIEVIAPKEVRVTFDSAQSIANAVAEIMHRYAAGGAGGIVISTKK